MNAFKECCSASEACAAVRRGLLTKFRSPDITIHCCPMADGGDGTLDVLVGNKKGRYISLEASDPLGRMVETKYGIVNDGQTAVIEMAEISGLWRLTDAEKNPLLTSTYGTGELMKHAINKQRVKNILLCIGGSATNDGGIGMAAALGAEFYNSKGEVIRATGGNLQNISRFEVPKDSTLEHIRLNNI
eukprot:UN30929